jgi:hypothetical protein
MQGQQRGAQERKRGGGWRERRKTERAKEVARAAGYKATGAWVIGGRGERRHAMEEGCDGKALRCGAGDRYKYIALV